jgi:hypothetical protein
MWRQKIYGDKRSIKFLQKIYPKGFSGTPTLIVFRGPDVDENSELSKKRWIR